MNVQPTVPTTDDEDLMTAETSTTATPTRPSGPLAFVLAVVVPAVVATVLCTVVAAIAHGAGASHAFKALDVPVFTVFVVVGLLAGAVGWNVIRRRSADPGRLLRLLVPTVVGVSLLPDIAVGAGASLPGTSWGAVTALMVMHVVVAACGVVAYRVFLPLTPQGARS